ncbi:MAG: phosphatase PAP2 family protein [Muribaculaceae bacterium]|nr:phosphatase PAP2 family protein [Muribaculaceae bacterium]
MKSLSLLIIIILLSLDPTSLKAQEIYIPPSTPEAPLQLSKSQKGVALSTDILLWSMPIATVAGAIIDNDWEGIKQGTCTAAVTAAATLILKYSVYEMRPNHKNSHSFPSGHCAVTFATAGFLQRRYGWKLGAPAYALASYVAWGRIYSKNHHWWDTLAGAAIGAGSAYLFTRPKNNKTEISLIPVSDGITHGFSASITF